MPIQDAFFTVVLGSALAAISVHDFKHYRVPDLLSLFIAFAGMLFWLLASPADLPIQLLYGFAFGASLWFMREAHFRLAGRIGLGLGDVKLAAAGAIWLNPVMLPLLLFVASLTGLVFAFATAFAHGARLSQIRIAFAPFLGTAILFCWLVERLP
jgi:leader peptidase (prepilin peptidase) / N-methyltransferase